jgi:multidrug efflux pump subunit AcrA (membrane-fusion protein)
VAAGSPVVAAGAGRRVPDQAAGSFGRDRARRRPLVIGAIVIVAVLVAGGATAWAVSDSGNSGYRMTQVTRATIAEGQDVVGTVEPVTNASASFQVSGQVATVTATVGEQVTAGESLGTLDTTSLTEAVSSAQSSVASDDAQLTEDEDSETSSTATTTTTTTTTTPASTGSSSPSGGKSGGSGSGSGSSEITQDQAAVVAAQSTASTDQQQEAADLSQAETACGVTGTGTGTGSSPTGSTGSGGPGGSGGSGSQGPTTTTTTTTPTTTTTTTPTEEDGCTTALEQVSAQQQAVATAQNVVATAESALAKVLAQEESTSTTPSTGTTATTPSTGTTGTTSRLGDTGSGGSGNSSPSDSAATIASDEAAIDTAQAALVNAQQSLTDAQLVSPIAGTIASVGISVGATVSANSSTDAIVIIGTQAFETTATLTSSQVTSVKVGDTANVLVDGATTTIAGTVSQVGPVQSSDGTYSYPLVVSLPTSATGLFTGSTASISVITSQAKNVLAVPTSAVTTNGTRQYVLVLSDGTLTEKTIKAGLVGYTYTQVISGLKEGDSVVLADYAEPVPTSNTATTGGFGGFGGAGGIGGGAGRFTEVGGGGTAFGR